MLRNNCALAVHFCARAVFFRAHCGKSSVDTLLRFIWRDSGYMMF
jgi:hypothetical protein